MKLLCRNDNVSAFVRSLQVGEIFGFSSAYKKENVIRFGEDAGVALSPPAKTTPEYKKYGEYVLKVRSIHDYPRKAVLHIEKSTYFMELAKRSRKCSGYKTETHTIPEAESCVIELLPDRLGDGTPILKKKTYCIACTRRALQAEVKKITQFIGDFKK